MTTSANDKFFDIKAQLRSLNEDEAVQLASTFIDQYCDELDADYLKRVIGTTGGDTLELTREFATKGSPAAQTALGAAQLYGRHMEQDVSHGLFWLRRAHNNGNLKASIVLGGAYLDDAALTRDSAKAAGYFTVAAEGGEAVAQYIFANLLIEGDGIAQDEEAGISWLRRSALRGYGRALEMLRENDIPLHDE